MTEAKRRYTGQQFETIPAGGGWDEWFKIRTTVTMDDLAMVYSELGDNPTALGEKSIEVVNRMMERMIVEWSLPELLNAQAIRALPYDMLQPVFATISRFLAIARNAPLSATTTSSDSKPSITASPLPTIETTTP